MKISIERITNKGNSSLLLQLAERVSGGELTSVSDPPPPAISSHLDVPSEYPSHMRANPHENAENGEGRSPLSQNTPPPVSSSHLDVPSEYPSHMRANPHENAENGEGRSPLSQNTPISEPPVTTFQMTSNRDFFRMNSRVSHNEMKSKLCNEKGMECWDVNMFTRLRELLVGDECLQFVKELSLSGLHVLERVCIGSRCFTNAVGGRLDMSDCEALKSVEIGEGSFVNWSCFVMKKCECVEEVRIGDGCFVCSEHVVFEGEG